MADSLVFILHLDDQISLFSPHDWLCFAASQERTISHQYLVRIASSHASFPAHLPRFHPPDFLETSRKKSCLMARDRYDRTCREPRGGKVICFPFPYLRNSGSKTFLFFSSVPCFLLRLIRRFGLSAVSSALIPRLWIGIINNITSGTYLNQFEPPQAQSPFQRCFWSNVKTRYDLLPIRRRAA